MFLHQSLILCLRTFWWESDFMLKYEMNHQIRPWIFTSRPNSFLNYAKYQLSPWICQTSIKKVPPSKCSVSHVDLLSSMFCCLVHVVRRKPHVQGLIWLNWKKFNFHFSVYFFLLFSFCTCITHTSFFTFQSETSKTSLTRLLPAKTFFILTPPKSSSSPAILTFLKFLCSAVIKGNAFPVDYQLSVFVFTLIKHVCFGFFSLFCTLMFQGSIWYLIKQFRDLFDGFLI